MRLVHNYLLIIVIYPLQVSNSNWLECPKKDQLSKILLKYHDVLGHIGINATFTSISKKYYWKHISHDVREYVSAFAIRIATACVF